MQSCKTRPHRADLLKNVEQRTPFTAGLSIASGAAHGAQRCYWVLLVLSAKTSEGRQRKSATATDKEDFAG
jgi:hypothetical protein